MLNAILLQKKSYYAQVPVFQLLANRVYPVLLYKQCGNFLIHRIPDFTTLPSTNNDVQVCVIINDKAHIICNIGSKGPTIFLNGWILPFGALGRVCHQWGYPI